LVLGLLSVPVSALADTAPSRWERAKDPRVGEDWDLHVKVTEELSAGLMGRRRTDDQQRYEEQRRYEVARGWLEEAHAEKSPDVRLRFDLGEVYERLERHQRAVDVLAPALALAPDHPAATDAWIEISYAYAHLDRSREELAAYDAYLARTQSVNGRATALLNRAEAEMRLGQLEDAISGYKDAISVSESISGVPSLVHNRVLSLWGLAVALDRSGDTAGGAREAARAVQDDAGMPGAWPRGSIIAGEDPEVRVFFVPDYETFYYLGLGMFEYARQAAGAHAAALRWKGAESFWERYVAGAEAWDRTHKSNPDRWLSRAKAHLARARKQRALAERRPP
jgi:tetratricopeptide (TPR) repeat protein